MVFNKRGFQVNTYFVLILGLICCSIGCSSKKEEIAKKQKYKLEQQVQELQATIQMLEKEQANAISLNNSNGAYRIEVTDDQKKSEPLSKKLTEPNINDDRKSELFKVALKNAVVNMIDRDSDVQGAEEIVLLKKENDELKTELKKLQVLLQDKGSKILFGSESGKGAIEVQQEEIFSEEWDTRKNTAHKINFLESLAELNLGRYTEILPILEQAIEDSDSQVGITASKLLKEYKSLEVLSAIETALLSPNEQVRLNAVGALSGVDDPFVLDLLDMALNDSSNKVRNKALDTVNQQEGDIQLESLLVAMASKYDEVKTESLSLLDLRGDRQSVPIVMEGLKDSSSEYREEVNTVLSFLVDQEFSTYDQAIKWWHNNKDRYDEDLFEK